MKQLGFEGDLSPKSNNDVAVNDSEHLHDITLFGIELKETEINENCIILCYNNLDEMKSVFDVLKYKTNSKINLKVIITPFDDPKFKIIIRFINRNKDVYQPGCIPTNIKTDFQREIDFLSNINTYDKIIYVGDVIKWEKV